MSSREDVVAAVQSLEDAEAAPVDQVLPDQVVPDPAAQVEAEAPQGETSEEKEVRLGRTAGRPRDEKGRLLPGKPVKEAVAPDTAPVLTNKIAEPTATPAAVPQAPAIPLPKSIKREHLPAWNKWAAPI